MGKKNASHSKTVGRKDPGNRNRKVLRHPGRLAEKTGERQVKSPDEKIKKASSRASAAGWHFISLYQACPRKFYYRHLRGFVPEKTAPVLLFGGAFHAGKAQWYLTGSKTKALREAVGYLDSLAEEYETAFTLEVEKIRLINLLEAWIDRFGKEDLKYYNILGVEEELEASLYNRFRITGRADAILQPKGNKHRGILLETKTTGYSVEVTYQGLMNSDQITAYLWLLGKTHPEWKVDSCLPDIAYSHASRIELVREDLIFRTSRRLQEFEYQTVGILNDISQRVRALATGKYPLSMLFPRNAAPGWCTSFNRACEYAGICDSDVPPGVVPEGFHLDEWVDYSKILNLKEVTWKGFNSEKRSGERSRKGGSSSRAGRISSGSGSSPMRGKRKFPYVSTRP